MPDDALSLGTGTLTFQRSLSIGDGNASPEQQLALTVRSSLPIFLVCLVPYLAYLLFTSRCNVERFFLALEKVDVYSLDDPDEKGLSPYFNPTPLGGSLTLLTFGGIVTLMVSSVVTYNTSNTLLVQSSLVLTPAATSAFALLPLSPSSVLPGAPGSYDAGLAALLAPSSSKTAAMGGVAIAVRTHGSRCGVIWPNATTWSLPSGAFTSASTFDAATGAAVHTFTCAKCFFSQLSYLTMALDSSCQTFAVTVAAVGVAGGVTVSAAKFSASSAASPLAAAAMTVPVSLEVIQDAVAGVARAGESFVQGGRSAAGFVASAVAGVTLTPVTAASTAPVTVTIYLPLKDVYALASLSPIMTLFGLASACAAWLGLIGTGGVLKTAHKMCHRVKASVKKAEVAPKEESVSNDATKLDAGAEKQQDAAPP